MKSCFFYLQISAFCLPLLGCLLPQEPGGDIYSSRNVLSGEQGESGYIEEYKLVASKKRVSSAHETRNVIFVAVENEYDHILGPLLRKAYKEKGLRVEDFAWWLAAPTFAGLYDKVIKISRDGFSYKSLVIALNDMERMGKSYDLVLLTHGVPNRIVSSEGFDPITFDDIASLQGKLRHLNLVYMQACFGGTLARDWLSSGAQAVIAFSGEMENFFYPTFFFEAYKRHPESAFDAFKESNSIIRRKIRQDRDGLLYRKIIQAMRYDIDSFLEQKMVDPQYYAPTVPGSGMDLQIFHE